MDPFSNLMFFWGQPADATTAPMIHAISLAATRKPAPGLSTRLRCLSHGFMWFAEGPSLCRRLGNCLENRL